MIGGIVFVILGILGCGLLFVAVGMLFDSDILTNIGLGILLILLAITMIALLAAGVSILIGV